MTPLQSLLASFRTAAASEREKGTYFEELIVCYLRNEASYRDLYSDVWTYGQWADAEKLDKRDTGIDLVAKVRGTGEIHAIQCKLFAENYRLQKGDIDSFFTASGKKPFTHRIIVSSTNHWTEHAEDALRDQQPPVSKIDLNDLENSQIDWSKYQSKAAPSLKPKKSLLGHQKVALEKVVDALSTADRGKLIMACGTGKTFTSLKIAESVAGKDKRVLFLVPSLALLSQALTDWTQESSTPLHSFAVCSDSDVGKKRRKDDDSVQTFTHELRYPATTNAARLASEMAKRHDAEHMSVVFSTYHSIDVISQAQTEHGLPPFDLVVCDEAHRTTGATFGDEDESNFVKVHDGEFLKAAKRLYMTATPRIYGDSAKATAERDNVALCSMDDEKLYGKELFVITFSEAVKRGLLVDYKVIVLAVEETHVNRRLQKLLADGDNQLKVDDAAKIIGCWKALAKQGLEGPDAETEPMRRAVAFCQVIDIIKGAKTHKVSSKNIAGMFQAVVEAYQESELDEAASNLKCEAEHVDGSMNASEKEEKLAWLKAEPPENTCRILSNVRCLSEGVDVPALDAVLFLTPRNSQVDVVQSVGRVMRNAPGKGLGYVILPVVIPAGVEPHEALNDNKTYAVVWQVLQALRSHDDRFDAMVNKLDLTGKDTSKMEVIAITDKIQRKQKATTGTKNKDAGKGNFTIGEPEPKRYDKEDQGELQFEIGEIEKAIYAKLVQKVGNRHHWEDWATDIAKIARTHIDRITAVVQDSENSEERAAFNAFAKELRDDLNGSISDAEIVEMLAQHLITKPVFEALFDGYSFAQKNPISLALEKVLTILERQHLSKEADPLHDFYASVKLRAEGITSDSAKQKIIVELYNNFFQKAFPRLKDKLGIVYTPIEVVDFILQSVADLLRSQFGESLGNKNVHIIDPFTGTGTFITRLMQSGLLPKEQLREKYRGELHANEIILLAYYIAAINIEAAFHGIVGGEYEPFQGICLSDTFQMYEKDDLVSSLLQDNGNRRTRQKALDIRVIVGNPPYSSGDTKDENNKNVQYPQLDQRITETYAARSSESMGKSKLYDSYIRAIRWASDRIGSTGVIGFVSGFGFAESNSTDGLRKCLADEFSNIYLINLRGNIRKNMLTNGRAREGENVFGNSSMTGIAITILVKNEESGTKGQIYYWDIGDDLKRTDKLAILARTGSIEHVQWRHITPNTYGDWLGQRNSDFERFILIGDKSGGNSLFASYSMGIKTNRDDWTYNKSKSRLLENMARTIQFYNSEVARFDSELRIGDTADFVKRDSTQIKWTTDLLNDLQRGRISRLEPDCAAISLYRPFEKQWVYSNKTWNWTRHRMPSMFPTKEADNLLILVKTRWTGGQIALMTNVVPTFTSDGGEQCFPLYLYDVAESVAQETIFNHVDTQPPRRSGISSYGLQLFKSAYGPDVSERDIFFFVYGMLHSPDYLQRFSDNLTKDLPRIPLLKSKDDFRTFVNAGQKLGDLHVCYETVPPYPVEVTNRVGNHPPDFRVEKMRYGKKGKDKDLTTLHYNDKITLTGIPLEAYEYVVNGKPALDWVVERQCVKVDKDSGIVNDANDWAIETMNNPRYPLELFQRVITVSLETMKIVKSLPALDIMEDVSIEDVVQPIKTKPTEAVLDAAQVQKLEESLADPYKAALESVVADVKRSTKPGE